LQSFSFPFQTLGVAFIPIANFLVYWFIILLEHMFSLLRSQLAIQFLVPWRGLFWASKFSIRSLWIRSFNDNSYHPLHTVNIRIEINSLSGFFLSKIPNYLNKSNILPITIPKYFIWRLSMPELDGSRSWMVLWKSCQTQISTRTWDRAITH
jgi:hypothetical protein